MPRLSLFAFLGGLAAALVFAVLLCLAPAARAGSAAAPPTPAALPSAIEPLAASGVLTAATWRLAAA